MRSRTRCYDPTSTFEIFVSARTIKRHHHHRRVGREVKGGKGFMARVGNMSSGICMREEGANSVRGPKLNDQIVLKGRVGK